MLSLSLVAALLVGSACGAAGEGQGIAVATDEARTLSDIEAVGWLAGCVGRSGFDVTVKENPGFAPSFVADVSDERIAVYDRVVADCEAEMVAAGLVTVPGPRSEEDVRATYDFLLKAAECLRSEGVDVDPAPSFGTFADNGGVWSPHAAVVLGSYSQDETVRLFVACPQAPGS